MQRVVAIFLFLVIVLAACGTEPTPATDLPVGVVTVGPGAQLGGIRTYLLDKAGAMQKNTAALKSTADRYYEMVQGAGGDYAALVQQNGAEVATLLRQGRDFWSAASPLYEEIEGIVAGGPHFSRFHMILHGGSSEEEGGSAIAPVDVALPDGRVLVKPGNLFALTRATLWGSDPDNVIAGAQIDVDGDGKQDALPDANVLKGAAAALDSYTNEMITTAQQWDPSLGDAFTALVLMVPTVADRFQLWKGGVAGGSPADSAASITAIGNMLAGLGVVQSELSTTISENDPDQERIIAQGLRELQGYVTDVGTQAAAGPISAEEADLISTEAGNRATAITGQITQVMEKMGVQLEVGGATCTGVMPLGTPTVVPAEQ